jgi:replication factor C small subunit
MEMYTKTASFILSCNYSSKIIDPIQSRCAIFRFAPLKAEEIKERLEFICENEGFDELNFAFLVYETPQNLCSERAIIQKWLHENEMKIEEWHK